MKKLLTVALLLQIMVYVAILLDIPVFRQVLSFVFLLFVPGAACLKILKIGKLDLLEFSLLSVGVSIAFLMITGAVANQIYPVFGYAQPLSALSVILTINIITTALLAIAFFTEGDLPINLNIHIGNKFLLLSLFLLLLPILSIVGATWVNIYMNNSILLLMIILITAFVLLAAVAKKIPPEVYPIAVLAIAIALLFHEELTTPYIYGYDMHLEYYLFNLTKQTAVWPNVVALAPFFTTDTLNYNAMLSITVLPTVFSNFLNLQEISVFKIAYPLIFSLVPLGLFKIYQKAMGYKAAFLATVFFMSLFTFYRELLSLGRQMIAEVFLLLLLFLFLDTKIGKLPKTALILLFTTGLTVSHYSTSYIYLFMLFFAWALSILFKMKTQITKWYLGFTSAVIFAWAIFTSESALLKDIINFVVGRFNALFVDFFNPSSRQDDVLRAIGIGGAAESLGHTIGRYSNYLTEIFIIIGFLAIILMHQRFKKEYNFRQEHILFSYASMALLIMSIALPFFAQAINISRIYHLVLFALAPFFIIGGELIFRFPGKIIQKLTKRVNLKSLGLLGVTLVLMAYFLFNIGFIYEVTGDVPSSSALSMSKMKEANDPTIFYSKYVTRGEVYGAEWLSQFQNTSYRVYCDYDSRMHVLTSYGSISRDNLRVTILTNRTASIEENSYTYLRYLNIGYGKMVSAADYSIWNISDIEPLLLNQDKIYSNGECSIYTEGPK